MCALFCVGSVFECQGQFGDEDYILRWVEALLSSNNSTVYFFLFFLKYFWG